MNHTAIIRHKIGEDTGRRLLSAECLCGWRSGLWYSGEQYAIDSHARHLHAIETGSTVPWMVAPRSVA